MDFNVNFNRIDIANKEFMTSGAVNIFEAHFEFDESWNGYARTAVFRSGDYGAAVAVVLDATDTCKVPWESLIAEAPLWVGVVGVSGDKKLPTNYVNAGCVAEGAEGGEFAPPPTPSEIDQILSQIGDLRQLKTKAKDTLVDAINETYDRAGTGGGSGGTDIALGITGAQTGQIAKITAVDDNGAPTAWGAVDLPGGGDGTWTKVTDVEVAEATGVFTADGLNQATEIYIKWSNLQNSSTSDSGLNLYINDIQIAAIVAVVAKSGNVRYGWALCKYNGLVWSVTRASGATTPTNITTSPGNVTSPYNLMADVGAASKIQLRIPNAQLYAAVSGKLEVWVKSGSNGGGESGGPGDYITDVSEDFSVTNGRLYMIKSDQVESDNTHPITAAAVYAEVGNINALLSTI